MIYTDIKVSIKPFDFINQQTKKPMKNYRGRVSVYLEGLLLFNETTNARLDEGDAIIDADNIKLNWERNNRKV